MRIAAASDAVVVVTVVLVVEGLVGIFLEVRLAVSCWICSIVGAKWGSVGFMTEPMVVSSSSSDAPSAISGSSIIIQYNII